MCLLLLYQILHIIFERFHVWCKMLLKGIFIFLFYLKCIQSVGSEWRRLGSNPGRKDGSRKRNHSAKTLAVGRGVCLEDIPITARNRLPRQCMSRSLINDFCHMSWTARWGFWVTRMETRYVSDTGGHFILYSYSNNETKYMRNILTLCHQTLDILLVENL